MNCENCKLNPSCTMVWRKSKKECPHFIQRTNGDSIRDMSDEELVNLHYSGSAHCIASDPTVCGRHDFIGNLTPCEQCYLKWLQQPAEEDKHD